MPAIRYGGKAQVEPSINPPSTSLRRKSMRTQAQLHIPGAEVDLDLLAPQLFSETARLRLRSQQTAHGSAQISWATDDMATGFPHA